MKPSAFRALKISNILIAAALSATAAQSASAARVTVLHTNDTHSHVDDGVVPFSEIAAERARLEAAGESVILVDAGDYVQGTALGGFDSGRSVIDIMSAAGYKVATLGNHEFDYGVDNIGALVEQADFNVVTANWRYTGPAGAAAYARSDARRKKIEAVQV